MVTEALPGAASGPSIRKENVANWEHAIRAVPLMMFLVIGPSVFYGSSGTAAAATAQRAVSPAAASAHVAKPSYYVTPAGRKIAATAAGVDASGSGPAGYRTAHRPCCRRRCGSWTTSEITAGRCQSQALPGSVPRQLEGEHDLAAPGERPCPCGD
jgi:hypothetical protein